MAAENPYEVTARWRKATRLAAHLFAYDIKSHDVPKIEVEQWADLAKITHSSTVPSEDTIRIVAEIVLELERAAERAEAIRRQQVAR